MDKEGIKISMEEKIIGRNNRLKFYVACLFCDELDYYYSHSRKGVLSKAMRIKNKKIFAKARSMGAFI